jgi:hypothetical protein
VIFLAGIVAGEEKSTACGTGEGGAGGAPYIRWDIRWLFVVVVVIDDDE